MSPVVSSSRATSGDAGSLIPQGFASDVSGVFGVFGSKYTHTRTHMRAHAHTHELGAGDTEDIGDTGDSAQHVGSSRGVCVGGPLSRIIFRSDDFFDSTFARVPT